DKSSARLDLGEVDEPMAVEVVYQIAAGGAPRLELSWHTAEDSRPRALPLRRLILPWSRDEGTAEPSAPALPAELSGGSWSKGRALFFGKEARCSECHSLRGEGGHVGPDLSNLAHRDYASVLRDVREPSYAVNPDFLSYNVATADGRVLSGTVRSNGATLIV